jgi:cell division protein FtsI/penicillin-binding protein 2
LAIVAVLAAILTFVKYPHLANGMPSKDSRGGKTAAAAILPGNVPHPVSAPATDLSSASLEWQSPMRNYPRPDTFSYQGESVVAQYDPDSLLNARVNVYLQRYRPETGVILVADLHSGHVLAMGERQDSLISESPKLAFGGGFPAASLIKIMTATAALECKAKELTDSIPQVGGYHTLYKRQLKTEGLRRCPKITLEEAFSRSVNPAFGMLGLSMGPETLRSTAARMGFNRDAQSSIIAKSRIEIPDSGFSLAEAACGFTPKTTITPWHALQIARGAGDDGRLRACVFPRAILDLKSGKELPLPSDSGSYFVSPSNLPLLQGLMQATVRVGTARKGFHSVLKASHMDRIEAGGKTGSLDGEETPGRFDWFIGYVKMKDDPSRGLAFAIMLVHREYASIHASAMAALLIRDWMTAHDKAEREKAKAAKQREAQIAYRAA